MRNKMNLPFLSAAVCSILLAGATAHGQSTVQLPTFHVTGASTTVVVPDRGSALIGGVNRASSMNTSRGVPGLSRIPGIGRAFGNRATASAMSAGTISVTATIHDLREMDEALLAEAAARRSLDATSVARSELDRRADFLSRHVGQRTSFDDRAATIAGSKMPSLEEIRQQHAAEREELNAEAITLLDQGRQAEADGKPNVAKIFFQMAVRRASGDVKRDATLALERIAPASVAGR